MNDVNPYAPPKESYELEKRPSGRVLATLADAWALYRRQFPLIAAAVLVVCVPVELLASYMEFFVFGPEETMRAFRLTMFLDTFIGIIATAAAISIGSRAMTEKKPMFPEVMEDALSSWGRIWVARFFTTLAIFAGCLLLILPGIYLAVRLSLAETVAVAERLGGIDAMRRSFQLTRDRFRFLFRLGIIVVAIMMVVSTALQLALAAINHWIVDAGVRVALDFVGTYGTLCLFCAYHELAHHRATGGQAVVFSTITGGENRARG